MPEVTDPELLKQLEASEPGEVTDPELLRQLEGGGQSSQLGDFFKSIPRGIVGGFAGAASALGRAEAPTSMPPEQAAQVPGPEESTKLLEQNVTGELHQPETGPGRYGEQVGQALGSPATWMGPGGPISKTIGAVGGALGGEAAGEATKGSAFEIPARFLGSMLGAHTVLLPPKVGAPLKPIAADRQALIDTLKGEGVTSLTAGQQRGSKGLRYLESITADSPLSGTGAEEINEASKKQFTGAVLKRMGEDAEAATPDVIERARERIGDKMDEVAKKLPITFSKDFGDRLAGIEQDLTNEGLAPEQVNRITKNIENVRNAFITKGEKPTPLQTTLQQKGNLNRPINQATLDEMRAAAGGAPSNMADALAQQVTNANASSAINTPKGVMPGSAYQMLTRKNTPLDRLTNSQNPDERFYGGRIRDALDEAMWKSANARGTREGTGRRQAAKDLLEARRQWRTMVMASKAVAGGGEDAAKGYISPAQLRMQLAGNPQDKLLYARGGGMKDLGDLSRAGNAIMTPLPNSGTSQREQAREMFNLATTLKGSEPGAAAGGAIGGIFGGIPGALMGAAAGPFATGMGGRILHSQPVQKYLTNQLPGQQWISENRPGASPAWLSLVNVLRGHDQKEER